jgi:hypothetical protein
MTMFRSHLALFNIKSLIQFPVGSAALMSSRCVPLVNTPIQIGENRPIQCRLRNMQLRDFFFGVGFRSTYRVFGQHVTK